MKKLVPILLVLILTLVYGCAEIIEEDEGYTMYVLCRPGDFVNVREHPTTRAFKAGYLECGDSIITDGIVRKDNQGRQWTHITRPWFESADAWVCSMYLQDTQINMDECTGYVVSNGRTAVRRAPGGKCVKWVKNGTKVAILAMSEEWALTTNGYINMDYLEISNE